MLRSDALSGGTTGATSCSNNHPLGNEYLQRRGLTVGRATIRGPSQMAARQERIDAFDHEGSPPTDQPLEILCEDHSGTYVIPFLCRWSDGTWQNAKTRRSIEVAVIGWREAKRDQR
jgi:hypothetical protein